jgi:hypothetical protein
MDIHRTFELWRAARGHEEDEAYPARIGISQAAVDAWQAGDFAGLMRAPDLGLHVPHPWPLEATLLGCGQEPYEVAHPWDKTPAPWRVTAWQHAQALQRALLEIAGPPGRLDGEEDAAKSRP